MFPLFAVSVTGSVVATLETATLLKLSEVVLNPKLDALPVPVRLMLFCVPFEEFATNVPVRVPETVGMNVTLPVQVPPEATVVGQFVGAKAKSPVVPILKFTA